MTRKCTEAILFPVRIIINKVDKNNKLKQSPIAKLIHFNEELNILFERLNLFP